jgi:hypothetical protein
MLGWSNLQRQLNGSNTLASQAVTGLTLIYEDRSMKADDINAAAPTEPRLTRSQKRAFMKEFGLDRPRQATKAVVNARERARKWRDHRRDAGIPDNRLIGNLCLKVLLRIEAEKVAARKPGLDNFFAAVLNELPTRFDRSATQKLIERYRNGALEKVYEEQFLDEVRGRRTPS